MKRLIFLILLLPLSISAQYAVADFFVINEGKEKDYEKLEMAWSIFRQNQIDKGQKMDWAVWKITPRKDDRANAADYVVFNQFKTKEEMDKYLKGDSNFSYSSAASIMRRGMKGMSKNSILRLITPSKNKIKKEVRTYQIQILDATPFTGGDLKIGEKINMGAMVQKSDDYEQMESNIYKPYVLEQVKNGLHRGWAFVKVVGKSENAFNEVTHFTFNIPVEGAKWPPFFVENEFITKKLTDMMFNSRSTPYGGAELTLMMQKQSN